MTSREEAKIYLAEHHIPQLFECLLSCLMLERPGDPVQFIEGKMSQIKEKGIANINWKTFVLHFNPYKDDVKSHNKDGNKYDNELSNGAGYDQKNSNSELYNPEVFKLTERSSY